MQFDPTIRAAATACKHAPSLLLDSGPGRPSVPVTVWPGILPQIRPWITAGGKGVARHMRLHLRNPPSPTQLALVRSLPWLHTLGIQHSHSAIYSRHLAAIANITQLQELELLMEMPKLELRSLAHQRLRRVPLKADCLSSLVNLNRLEISCKAYTGADVLPGVQYPHDFSRLSTLLGASALSLVAAQLECTAPWPAPVSYAGFCGAACFG